MRIKKTFTKRQCSICNKSFMPVRANNDKCSTACRLTWARGYSLRRNAHIKKCRATEHVKNTCSVCLKPFTGYARRKTCSTECSKQYTTKKYAEFVENKMIREIDRSIVKPKIVFVEYKKDIPKLTVLASPSRYAERCQIIDAMREFKARGGKITVLAPEPNQPIPSVDFPFGHDYEARCGIGLYAGSAEYVQKEELL